LPKKKLEHDKVADTPVNRELVLHQMTDSIKNHSSTFISQRDMESGENRLAGISQEQLRNMPFIEFISQYSQTPKIYEYDVKEVASQLTLMEHDLFCNIRPTELLEKAWSNQDYGESMAPNVCGMIFRFNQVCNWVSFEVMKPENLKERIKILKTFIKIAKQCYELHNYHGVMEILSALNNSAVVRMKKTWDGLSKKKKAMFQEVSDLFESNLNFQKYRNALEKTKPPCLPFLGLYLKYLTFIEDGNPTMDGDLINFTKMRMIAKVIEEIQSYQSEAYSIKPNATIQQYLIKVEPINDKELFELSLLREPRQKK